MILGFGYFSHKMSSTGILVDACALARIPSSYSVSSACLHDTVAVLAHHLINGIVKIIHVHFIHWCTDEVHNLELWS